MAGFAYHELCGQWAIQSQRFIAKNTESAWGKESGSLVECGVYMWELMFCKVLAGRRAASGVGLCFSVPGIHCKDLAISCHFNVPTLIFGMNGLFETPRCSRGLFEWLDARIGAV